ncbi:hypothetical protein ACTWQB_16860, partial [Piscibacillus sp. B03]
FDIVLVDAGCHFDNANMVQSLYSSDYRFLLMNQQIKSQRKWKETFRNILKPIGFTEEDFMMILNQYDTTGALPKQKDIHQQLQIPVLISIPLVKQGWETEMNKQTLYEQENIRYQESIDIVARTIASNADLSFGEIERKRSKFGLRI